MARPGEWIFSTFDPPVNEKVQQNGTFTCFLRRGDENWFLTVRHQIRKLDEVLDEYVSCSHVSDKEGSEMYQPDIAGLWDMSPLIALPRDCDAAAVPVPTYMPVPEGEGGYSTKYSINVNDNRKNILVPITYDPNANVEEGEDIFCVTDWHPPKEGIEINRYDIPRRYPGTITSVYRFDETEQLYRFDIRIPNFHEGTSGSPIFLTDPDNPDRIGGIIGMISAPSGPDLLWCVPVSYALLRFNDISNDNLRPFEVALDTPGEVIR